MTYPSGPYSPGAYPPGPHPPGPHPPGPHPPGPVAPPPARRRWSAFPIAGLIVAVVLVLAGIGAIVYTLRSHDPSLRSKDGTIIRAGQLQPLELRVGDCARVPASMAVNSVRTVLVVPCSQLHNGQVYTVVSGSGPYPDQQTLEDDALGDCRDAIPDYLGSDDTPLHVVVYVPERGAWTAGQRAEQCLLVDRAKDITGDIRDDH